MEKAAQFPESEQEEGQSVPGLDPTNVPDDDDRAGKSNNDLWICEVCSKEFNSKKSLGGHKRVHAQLQKSSKKPPPTLKIDESCSCEVCDKRFTSQRSLWGHMRCHTNKGLKEDAEKANEEVAVDALMLLATGDEPYRLRSMQEVEEEQNLRKRKREEMTENGGHQRFHWRGSYGPSSSSAAEGGEGSGGGRSSEEGKTVAFDFDLNELPPEEDGDADQPAEM